MAENETAASTLLESVAVRLKQARIARGLSLEELSGRLSISRPHLEKIEAREFSFLAPPYILAYLKEYCREMGILDEALLEECRKELAVSSGPPPTQLITDGAPSSHPAVPPWFRRIPFPPILSRTAVAMAVIVLLLAILLLGKSLFAAPAGVASSTMATPVPAPEPPAGLQPPSNL